MPSRPTRDAQKKISHVTLGASRITQLLAALHSSLSRRIDSLAFSWYTVAFVAPLETAGTFQKQPYSFIRAFCSFFPAGTAPRPLTVSSERNECVRRKGATRLKAVLSGISHVESRFVAGVVSVVARVIFFFPFLLFVACRARLNVFASRARPARLNPVTQQTRNNFFIFYCARLRAYLPLHNKSRHRH